MSPTGRGSSGFTLIELMVTLSLAGLLLALVPPLLDKGGDRARLAHDRRLLLSQLRLARSQAIAGNRPVALRFDLDHRLFGIESLGQKIDDSIAVTLDTPLAEAGEIRFFPDGSASGAVIGLANRSGRVRLAVDWLTGSVEAAP
jgi:general secretion pathway protein H